METAAMKSLGQVVSQTLRNALKEFDILFAILFVSSYISPTLSAFFDVKDPFKTVILFGIWALSVLVNGFFVKGYFKNGGFKNFIVRFFKNRRFIELLLLGVWLAFLLLSAVTDRGVNGFIGFSYFSIFAAMYLVDYTYDLLDSRYKVRYVIYAVFFVFAVEGLRSAIYLNSGDIHRAYTSRSLATSLFNEAERYALMLQGVGGYEFYTGLSIFTGILLLYMVKLKRRALSVVMLLICLASLYMSSFTFAILFALLAVFVAFIYALARLRGRDRRFIGFLSVGVVIMYLVLFFGGLQINLFPSVMYNSKANDVLKNYLQFGQAQDPGAMQDIPAEIIEEDNPMMLPMEDRLQAEQAQGGGGMWNTRMKLYRVSLNTFLKNPLFGVGPSINYISAPIGGHSTWLDYLAMYGILQFGFFMAFFVLLMRRVWKGTRGSERYLRMVAFAVFIAYGLVNPIISFKVFPVLLCIFMAGNLPEDGRGYDSERRQKN